MIIFKFDYLWIKKCIPQKVTAAQNYNNIKTKMQKIGSNKISYSSYLFAFVEKFQ